MEAKFFVVGVDLLYRSGLVTVFEEILEEEPELDFSLIGEDIKGEVED